MKDRALIHLSLILSISALAYAAWVHRHSEQMATQALRQREQELVTKFAPKVRSISLEMLGVQHDFAKKPTTLEELFLPFTTIVTKIGEYPGKDLGK